MKEMTVDYSDTLRSKLAEIIGFDATRFEGKAI